MRQGMDGKRRVKSYPEIIDCLGTFNSPHPLEFADKNVIDNILIAQILILRVEFLYVCFRWRKK